jgi:hypothetical protein
MVGSLLSGATAFSADVGTIGSQLQTTRNGIEVSSSGR